jgi:hypothetical protein
MHCSGVFCTHELHDGLKYDLKKPLTPGFSTSHSLALGSSVEPPSYWFGSTYATETGVCVILWCACLCDVPTPTSLLPFGSRLVPLFHLTLLFGTILKPSINHWVVPFMTTPVSCPAYNAYFGTALDFLQATSLVTAFVSLHSLTPLHCRCS